jgi:hypothetical protein
MKMCLQKVISKETFCFLFIFVDVLKVTDENNTIRIRIHKSEVWICESGSVPKFHGSATLVVHYVHGARNSLCGSRMNLHGFRMSQQGPE